MKFSKIVITGLLVVLFFTDFKEAPVYYQNSLIEVYFSNKLDIADLAEIKADLAEKGFKLNYDYLKFGDNGKLTAIKYYVKAEKFGGGDESYNLNNELGFIINTSPNRKYDIIVGTKDQIQKKE
ncbi:MAG: hypothetical protein Q8898_14185 [Bacillota bacterium]|nr:hypothetical protein [Bacillota bacterium]